MELMQIMSMNILQQARDLELPTRQAMLERSPSVQAFWDHNSSILSEAWSQWETSEQEKLHSLSESLLDERLRDAVIQAWEAQIPLRPMVLLLFKGA